MKHLTDLTDLTRPAHPKLRSVVGAPRPAPARPLDLRVRAQRIQIDELIVDDPRQVLAHAGQAALNDPDTAALLGHDPATPLSLPAAAALLCALYDTDVLTAMGLRLTRRTTRVSASDQQTEPVSLVRSTAPDQEGRAFRPDDRTAG
ncbi:hypothetical protein AMK17_07115 [Streptomyces sp. CB00072]|uniref:hypothetical protein n=2 Tax=Streptomyces TaxID=1883 RepID=UPI00093EBF49|nr:MULTISPECIES: hypothetical protein [Streptomyces]MCX4504107.1 hypothetical protein [Streptomyces anulatus]OKI59662.1 hypothetical protein AMK17_07115 [Streptomyces sp. CB00072]